MLLTGCEVAKTARQGFWVHNNALWCAEDTSYYTNIRAIQDALASCAEDLPFSACPSILSRWKAVREHLLD
jgi:hypothetical protein